MKKNVGVILLVALFGSLLLNVCQFVGVGHTEKPAHGWAPTSAEMSGMERPTLY